MAPAAPTPDASARPSEAAADPETAPRDRRLGPARRLRTTAEFGRVYRTGSRARGSTMTVAICANDLGRTRMGLSVGKVCWRRAVQRNRVRRLFREAFRLEREDLPPAADLVLIGAPRARPVLEETRAELRKLAWKAWRRYEEKLAQARENER